MIPASERNYYAEIIEILREIRKELHDLNEDLK